MSWGSVIAGLVCIGGIAYVGVDIAKDMVKQYEEKQKMKELTRYDIKVKITNYKTTYKGEQKEINLSKRTKTYEEAYNYVKRVYDKYNRQWKIESDSISHIKLRIYDIDSNPRYSYFPNLHEMSRNMLRYGEYSKPLEIQIKENYENVYDWFTFLKYTITSDQDELEHAMTITIDRTIMEE